MPAAREADGPAMPPAGGRELLAARRRNGLPSLPDRSVPLPRRLLGDWRLWLSLTLVVLFAGAFLLNWALFVPEHTTASGTIQGLGTDVIPRAARLAAFTAVPLTVLFVLADRLRPQGLWLWFVAVVWGGLVATGIAAPINTWASAHLSIVGNGDPATSMRGAVFIAPFVEEAAKATVVFGVAILLRNRLSSFLSTVSLAGLAGTGFAFVENVIYYGRIYRYVSVTSGTGDAQQAMDRLALMRGGLTFFAHPLFTIMTGIGIAVALGARSRRVRVLAPLVGYLLAVLLHMAFNFFASSPQGPGLMLWFIALSVVGSVVGLVLRRMRQERALVRARIGDFVRFGWLEEGDPDTLGRFVVRARAQWYAFWRGPGTYVSTLRLQRAVTELAYLRDAIDRGLVDATGQGREAELLGEISALRPAAVLLGEGAIDYPWKRLVRWLRTRRTDPSRGTPVPIHARIDDGTLRSSGTEYSPVDPRWGPPKQ